MLGDETEEEVPEAEGVEIAKDKVINPRSFNAKPVSWRMAVFLGGAVMNFVLALVLATVISMFNPYREATVHGFPETSPVREAGLMPGDRIVRIDGRRINVHGDLALVMMNADGSPMTLGVMRGGERLDFNITPIYNDGWRLGFFWGLGFGPFAEMPAEFEGLPGIRRVGFFESFVMGYHDVSFYIRATVVGVGRLITGGFSADEIMGPIGIVDTVGGSVSDAFETSGTSAALWTMLNFTVLLSANLGVLNLLPIPALDGGRMVFLILEAIRRKPIPPEREGIIHFIGFVLLMVLAAVVAYNNYTHEYIAIQLKSD
jgi:regulator of sigma E protease